MANHFNLVSSPILLSCQKHMRQSHVFRNFVTRNLLLTVLMLVVFIGVSGCSGERKPEISHGYGKSAGKDYSSSVNGTGVLKQMFRQAGHNVKTSSSLSPKIDEATTIVWFRDRFDAPSVEVVQRLEQWFDRGPTRQLIIVGRDHDSGISYWEEVVKRSQGAELLKAKRRLAQVKSEFFSRRMTDDSAGCAWYRTKRSDYRIADSLGGTWSKYITPSAADIHMGTAMIPKNTFGERFCGNSNIVLTANNQPLVTILNESGYGFGYVNSNHSIVLVSNSSFLTNYGMVNKKNRKLATRIVENSAGYKTVFIESGTEPVKVLSSDQNHETWAWVTNPPLKYIVPHFLLLGIFFCFGLYPIFGRPKRIETDVENTTFRTHIKAMARLLSRSRERNLAQEKIDRYINRQ